MPANGSSPKRRRTDDGASTTADAMAQSNATMHLFTGQRQNRWMSGYQATPFPNGQGALSGPVQTRLPASNNTNGNHGMSSTIAPDKPTNNSDTNRVTHGSSFDGGSHIESRLRTASVHIPVMDAAPLVDYQLPSMAERSGSDERRMSVGGRKSLEPSGGSISQQGLPSPAPSDENTNSPTVVNAPNPILKRPQRGPGRPRVSEASAQANIVRRGPGRPRLSDATAQADMPQRDAGRLTVQTNSPMQRPPISRPSPSPSNILEAQRQTPQAPQVLRRVQSQSGPTAGGSPNGRASPLGQPQIAQGQMGGAHRAPHILAQASHTRQSASPCPTHSLPPNAPQQQTAPHISSLFDQGILLEKVNTQLRSFGSADPAGLLYRYDIGRLSLLNEAVQRNDWFYIVLSQLCCLKTTSPVSLPYSVQRLNPASYEVLDSLICSNSNLHPQLVQWCAQFPLPIMGIYSSNGGAMYEQELRQVAQFLAALPTQWPILLAQSKQQNAPPLVHDMVSRLHLLSPILQTTAFRAIARSLWSTMSHLEIAIEYLVQVHLWDQADLEKGINRQLKQRSDALLGFTEVARQWDVYIKRVAESQQRSGATPQQDPPVFRIPLATYMAFNRAAPAVQIPAGQSGLITARQPPNGMVAHQRSASTQHSHPPEQTQLHPSESQRFIDQMSSLERGQHIATVPPSHRQSQASNSRGQLRPRHIFPPASAEARAQPTQPDPRRSALHQARLRSPSLGPIALQPSTPRMYRQVATWVLPPSRVHGSSPVHTFHFDMPADQFASIARKSASEQIGEVASRDTTEGTQTYRLRCVRNLPKGFEDEAAWVTADNVWPDSVYFQCNDITLEPRRKLHHGRYLPIDVSELVKKGTNTIKVFVNRRQQDKTSVDIAVAVEGICAMNHDTVIANLQTISADNSLTSIKEALTSGTDSNEDIVMTSSMLVIKLFDPISGSKIFDTPVRGQACLHRDCFDLETYLSIAKRDHPGWPSVVDTWRCPICRGDARPTQLVKDEFLVQVREELANKGLLETRSIIVEADGSWRPKVEDRTGVRSPSLEREERAASAAAAKKAAPVVIELD